MSGFDNIEAQLSARQQDGLYRQRLIVASPQGRELTIAGQQLVNFCSNDYLGLANDARVRNAFQDGVTQWGTGSGASHLITGHTDAHHELEQRLAEFTGRERCLLFASGYAANLGTTNALLSAGDYIFEDRLNHASLLDGGRLSGARFSRFKHRDLADLDAKLARCQTAAQRKLIVSDGTFSMDGTVCDVPGLVARGQTHAAWIMIDEAHSLGVTGRAGRGLVDADLFSTADVPILVGTLGKAFGVQGGFVSGSHALIETLIQHARTYIYSTALPAAAAVALITSLEIVKTEEWRRERLRQLVQQFREGAQQAGIRLTESTTPIQPIIIGDERQATNISSALAHSGVLVSAIRPPTVPKGTARLRITFTADHTDQDVEKLLATLKQTLE